MLHGTRGWLCGVVGLTVSCGAFVAIPVMATPAAVEAGEGESDCDFDRDGFADLAVGVRHDGARNAGAVNVLYGSGGAGLTHEGNQRWDQGTPGILGGNEWHDNFGATLACGDFDGDGFDDLAIGVPGEGLGGSPDVGVVQVLFGSDAALTADGNQHWHQDSPGILGTNEKRDHFRSSLANCSRARRPFIGG